jgi:threonylcarbamoyladenosine tRNA methylthiotransferase MtaB
MVVRNEGVESPSFLLWSQGTDVLMSDGRKRTFSIITFGCKLNQYESECIRQSLEELNWIYRPFEDGADCFIINSCTVTGKSDSRCRNAVRRARRMVPDATIVVTGCYAETQPEALEKMDEVDLVLGNDDKKNIPVILGGRSHETAGKETGNFGQIDEFLDHSRAFIKVQEGCNAGCTYCIIPLARGPSRSTPPAEVLDQVIRLVNNGYSEIVLTGIHIGRYGADFEDRIELSGLIELLLERTEGVRFRLSSIEINEVTDRLIGLITSSDRIASHLHLPLQSGDDLILEKMKRPYDTGLFEERIKRIANQNSRMALGTDIIVGFPGETDERFRNTYRFVKEMPFTYLHVFSYSKRPGTEAALMPEQVHPDARKSRSRRLINLGKRKRYAFMKGHIGSTELSLVQGPVNRFSKFSVALTGTYCEVMISHDERIRNTMLPVRITHYSRGRLYGTPLMEEVCAKRGSTT